MSVTEKISCGAIAAVAIVFLAAGAASADGSGDFATMADAWETAYNSGDAAAVAALYTEDGVAMPPHAKTAQGRGAIAAFLEEDMTTNPGTLDIQTVEHSHNGSLGFARGTYTLTDATGNLLDRGKWVEVRKKVDGRWYIHSDIWNSDQVAD